MRVFLLEWGVCGASEGLLTEVCIEPWMCLYWKSFICLPLTMIMPPQVTCLSLPLQPACECCVFTSPLPKLFFPSSTQIIFRITASRQPIPSLPVLFTLSNGYFQDYCTFVCMQYFMMLTTSSRKHPSFGASALGSGCHR